jgi:8-oxo-dGTP pyrophosphatase MutT (NUDIX family)
VITDQIFKALFMAIPDFHLLTEELKKRVSGQLPGADAHEVMSPAHRKDLLRMNPYKLNARLSGVLLLLSPGPENEALITFIKRNEYEGVHSGQIAFPGGKFEAGDLTLADTALREAEEEIGIKPSTVDLMGPLSELFVPPSNFIIQPFLARTGYINCFIPSPAEVASVFSVPLSHFLTPGIRGNYEIKYRNGSYLQVPGYKFQDHLIWGATAMILNELLELVQGSGFFRNQEINR